MFGNYAKIGSKIVANIDVKHRGETRMNFIKPKNKNVEKVDWLLSERTRAIVKYYAEYTEYGESEVVDKFLLNILEDKDFIAWIEKKRNNRRIVKQLELEHSLEEDVIG